MKLSIIIPAYNEKNTISEIIRQVQAVSLPGLEKEVIVVVTRDGSIFLEQKRTTLDALLEEFKGIRKDSPDVSVIIQGDEDALYGKVVRIMDFAKRAGITKLAVATRPAEKD